MQNKRGQSLSINTIIVLILAIAVLIVVIAGFSIGWDKISGYLSAKNVEEVRNSCSIACSTDAQYDFCFARKSLNSEDGKFKDVTCYYLTKNQPKYQIAECPEINCDNVVFPEAFDCVGNEGKSIQFFNESKKTLMHQDCLEVAA